MVSNFKIALAYRIPLLMVAVFWAVEGIESISAVDLDQWGIYPRTVHGLIGIFTSPFLHGNLNHLVSNSAIFILLGGSILYFFPKKGTEIFLLIYLITGFGVWLFARPAYHIGASGLIYGFAGMLFFSGIFRNELKYLVLSLILAIFYNSMLYGIFPSDPNVSWESHLIGTIVGGGVAFYFRKSGVEQPQSKGYAEANDKEGYQNLENEHLQYVYKESSPKQK